ncbi:ABC transporter ATP-binding protein [Streptococcus sp. 121]|uniref:ABC transporter ATP-binding protein n=1 Tax=Streptococcus sp. 121 TaxID=2797637 RepID=UPI0018F0B652|nr:ABC transporter ATP-binding protein [Streptococcus sp. 121]MBJ6746133.1 ABC transporter ATP-binding protein [Streptococcus sp. 121]
MKENKIAVSVQHVSKYFQLPTEATNSLRMSLINRLRGIKGYTEQHVLKDINFEVEKGDFFGILGRNGSGKSTLLKIISEIYQPEQGQVVIDGKLVSFIELGVGFNPELTGRENVYLNGALLGFTQNQIDDMYDEIVDFAELRDFMNQKLKNYSSGMQVRLAFSVAIKADSDILILDEVLAVGDEAFQRKCNDYFMERKQSGKTTILVTHDMGAVKKFCNKAVLIEDGHVKAYGNPENVANQYSYDNTAPLHQEYVEKQVHKEELVVENFQLDLLSPTQISPSDEIHFRIQYDIKQEMETYLALSLTDIDRNIWIYNDNSMDLKKVSSGHQEIHYRCSLPSVNNLKLKLEVTVRDADGKMLAFSDATQTPIIMVQRTDIAADDFSALDSTSGLIQRNGTWTFH